MIRSARPLVALGVGLAIVVGACSSPNASGQPGSGEPSSGGSSAPGESQPGGTLIAHLYQEWSSFYPWSEKGTGGDSIGMSLQWDYLAMYDEKDQPEMRLAESITPNEDATEWTVKLKKGLTWSDGEPFTAKDVTFSWRENMNPNHSYNASLWLGVQGVKEWQEAGDFSTDPAGITTPDDETVVFKLTTPNAGFLSLLMNFRNSILPEHAVLKAAPDIATLGQKDVWSLPYWQSPDVGIGPFLWTNTESGQFMSFKKNPTWRGDTPKFDELIIKPINDFAVAAAQLQSGDLDFAMVTLDDIDGLSSAGFQTGTALAPFPTQSDFNVSQASRFSDKRVRQAFMHGCDRQGFVDSFLKGKGSKADSIFFPEWVKKDGIVEYDFDLDKAKALLDEAGFDYAQPVKWLSWNKDARDRQSFLEDCQSKMQAIGVNIEIVNGLEVVQELQAKGEWDLALYGGNPIADPDQVRAFTACSAIGTQEAPNGFKWGGANYSNFCDPAFDELLDQGAKVADQAERAPLYEQAQQIWLDQVPIMINYRNATAYAFSPKLQGVVLYGDPSQAFLKVDQWSKSE